MEYKKYSKLLCDDKWIQLKSVVCPEQNINGYTYSHEIRCNGHIVSILPFRMRFSTENSPLEFLLRVEATPCWEFINPIPSSITGGIEDNETPEETAIKELREETGYAVSLSDLIPLGISYSTKSSDSVYHLFSVDLSKKIASYELETETELEKTSSCVWVGKDKLVECMDPFVAQCFVRLLGKYF